MARIRKSSGTGPEAVESTVTEASSTHNLVVDSVRSGAHAAQEAAARFVPTVGAGLRKATYMGLYYVSFGATFTALVAASMIPSKGFVRTALSDGAEAARGAYRQSRQKEIIHEADTVEMKTV